MPPVKVVIDEHIPFIRAAAARLFTDVKYCNGATLSRSDLTGADALIVRTRTRCDRALLEGTDVSFVATATAGCDHIDADYLFSRRISWSAAAGCNAGSVAQYVTNSLLALTADTPLRPRVVGIVGVGHVGRAVSRSLTRFGFDVVLYDPPREETEGIRLNTLRELQEECDVISVHTPLTFAGRWKTHGLVDRDFLSRCRRRPVILNAARGGVVCEADLLEALRSGGVSAAVIDTWENEPHINPSLLSAAVIATPHIAGYSADGKVGATRMALTAVCNHFGIDTSFTITPPPLPADLRPTGDPVRDALALYDPRRDSLALKQEPLKFEDLRNHYPLRREQFDLK